MLRTNEVLVLKWICSRNGAPNQIKEFLAILT